MSFEESGDGVDISREKVTAKQINPGRNKRRALAKRWLFVREYLLAGRGEFKVTVARILFFSFRKGKKSD